MPHDARVTELVWVEGDGPSVDRAAGRQLDGLAQAVAAEGVAAAFGCYGLVEGGAADGAHEGVVYFVYVIEVLVIKGDVRWAHFGTRYRGW